MGKRIDREILNERRAQTGFVDEGGAWYSLDNAGIIMPPMSDQVATSLFRIEAILDGVVDRPLLDRALAATATRFRYFNVQLRRGFFWYYFEPSGTVPHAEDDETVPCQGIDINKPGTRMFRIRVAGNRIAGEFSHALTDGSGAASFFKSLLAEYFRLGGVEPGAPLGEGFCHDIHTTDSIPEREEYEDGYRRHFSRELPHPKPGAKAWHLGSTRLPEGRYRVIGGVLSLSAVLAEVKKRGVSLTEFLAAVYIDCLQELWIACPKTPKSHLLSLEIPVNMRKFFPTRTKRNFSLFVLVIQDMRLGRRNFDDILERTHHQLRIENDSRSIAMQITRNVAGATNMSVRLIPLGVKDFFARILFSAYGDNMLSGFVSNLGPLVMPPGPSGHILGINFIPAPSKSTLTNASVLSWKDDLRIHFGSLAQSRDLERLFFTRLISLGLPVRMENRGGGE